MPIVIPLSRVPTTSSIVIRLSRGHLLTVSVEFAVRAALTRAREVVAQLVADAHQVELVGEALLEPVALVDVDRVDAVERGLGGADHPTVLGGDLAGDLEGRVVELVAGDHLEHRAELHQVGRLDRARREVEGPHHVLRHQPGHVGGRAECALVDLRDAEVGVVAGDDAVRVADQADAAADAEAVDRCDDRYGALVDRLERGVAAAVGAEQRVETGRVLHLLDVHAGVEALALGAEHDHLRGQVAARLVEGGRHVVPTLHGEGVDRGSVHGDDADPVLAQLAGDCHRTPWWLRSRRGTSFGTRRRLEAYQAFAW